MTLLGMNVHASYMHGRDAVVIDYVRKTRPRQMLVMDGVPLALSIREASPSTEVIYRAYVPDDVYMHQTPAQWFAQQRVYADRYGFSIYALNEPDFTPAVIEWLYQVAVLCVTHNVKAVLANLSVGRPEPNQWVLADKLLRLIAANPRLLTLGLHEYCPLLAHYEAGADPRHLPDFAPPRTWLLGRWRFLLDKYANVPVMITEAGWDSIEAARHWQEPRVGGWKKHIGTITSRVFWAANQPDDPDVYGAKQIAWALKHYYDYPQIRGVLLWCAGGSDPDWSDSDVTRLPRFLEELTKMSSAPAYTIEAAGERVVKATVVGATVNVRTQPHTGANVVTQLRPAQVIEYFEDSRATGSGYEWRRLSPTGHWFALVPGLTLTPHNSEREALLAELDKALTALEAARTVAAAWR